MINQSDSPDCNWKFGYWITNLIQFIIVIYIGLSDPADS